MSADGTNGLATAPTCVMNLSRFAACAALFASLGLFQAQAQTSPAKAVVTTERVRAELMVHAPDGVDPGKKVWLGLQLAHQPEWHTYWKNSGDSGLPTVLEWTLPQGVTAGDIAWPVPRKIPIGNLANYGYEGTVLLPVPLTIAPGFKPGLLGELEVKLRASWLVCRKECIPEEGEFALKVPARSSMAGNAAAFEAAFAAPGTQVQLLVRGVPRPARVATMPFAPHRYFRG